MPDQSFTPVVVLGELDVFYGQFTSDFKLEIAAVETNAAVLNYIGNS